MPLLLPRSLRVLKTKNKKQNWNYLLLTTAPGILHPLTTPPRVLHPLTFRHSPHHLELSTRSPSGIHITWNSSPAHLPVLTPPGVLNPLNFRYSPEYLEFFTRLSSLHALSHASFANTIAIKWRGVTFIFVDWSYNIVNMPLS